MLKLSDTANSLLALLNNINELIVKSSDRQSAEEVMRAFRVYADSKRFSVPQDKINNFFAVLIDARPYTLTTIIKGIADDVVSYDVQSHKPKRKNTEQ